MRKLPQIEAAGFAFQVIAEVGVSDADQSPDPFRYGAPPQADRAIFSDYVVHIYPRSGDRSAGFKLGHDSRYAVLLADE